MWSPLILLVGAALVSAKRHLPTRTLAARGDPPPVCGPTTSVSGSSTSTTYTANSGTSLVLSAKATGVAIGSCATVSASLLATATVQDGGYAILSGYISAFLYPATGAVSNYGTIISATLATMSASAPGFSSLSIQTMNTCGFNLDGSGDPEQFEVVIDTMAGGTLALTNPSAATISSATSHAQITLKAVGGATASLYVQRAGSAGLYTVSGAGATMIVSDGGGGNTVYMDDSYVSLEGAFDSLYASNAGATLIANELFGHVYVDSGATASVTGVGNIVNARSGYGSVGGSGAELMLTSGSFTVGGSADASVMGGATVVVQSDAGTVTVSQGGTATMLLGAVVTAPPMPYVALTPGPGASITEIGGARKRQLGDVTYLAVAAANSGGQRRALPRRTQGVCEFGKTYCPGQERGGFKCVDTTSDIYNCGGCIGLGGVDCTSITDEAVECFQGKCLLVA